MTFEVYIPSLTPATNYSIFCVTSSIEGVSADLATIITWREFVKTLCCKEIQISLRSNYVLIGSAFVDFIQILYNDRPHDSFIEKDHVYLSLVPKCSYVSYNPNDIFYPNNISFSEYYTGTMTYTGIINVLSNCLLTANVSGLGSDSYNAKFLTENSFNVVSYLDVFPVPFLLSAMFTPDGHSIKVLFNVATNRAQLPYIFPCNRLLSFSGSNNASCFWSLGNTTITIISNVLSPGDAITLIPSYLTTACVDDFCPIPALVNSVNSVSVSVLEPDQVVLPSVVSVCPEVVGAYDNVFVDLSSSTGNGNRNWKDSKVLLYSSTEFVDLSIATLNDGSTTIFPTVSVPRNILPSNGSVTLAFTLCNFLGKCGTDTCLVFLESSPYPSISIVGTKYQYISAHSPIYLQTVSLNDPSTVLRFKYHWKVSDKKLNSSATDPSSFYLAAELLAPGTTYHISVTVFDFLLKQYATSSVFVSVENPAVVCLLNIADKIDVPQGVTLFVDGSKSYLSHQPKLLGTNAGLFYNWEFIQIKPSFNSFCPNLVPSTGIHNATDRFYLSSNLAPEGLLCKLTVTVSAVYKEIMITDLRTVMITIVSSSAPSINIMSVPKFINPGSTVKLMGMINSSSIADGFWSVDDAIVDLSSLTLTSSKFAVSVGINIISLVIPGGTLVGGGVYSFTLSCISSTTTSSSFSVSVNSAPFPGILKVIPGEGYAMSTKFLSRAMNWADENLPLTYIFGSLSSMDEKQVLRAQSPISYSSILLPVGSIGNGYSTPCFVQVIDSLNANTTAVKEILVRPPSNSSLLFLSQALISTNLNDLSGRTNFAYQMVTSFSSLLNMLNCKNAPNCQLLNREQCSVIVDSCGPCLPGFVSNDQFLSAGNSICSATFETSLKLLSNENKLCHHSCNFQGSCRYRNRDTGSRRSECLISDSGCEAYCSCFTGYYGISCNDTTKTILTKQDIRQSLISTQLRLLSYEVISLFVMENWASNLHQLTSNTYEINLPSAVDSFVIMNLIIENFQDYPLPSQFLSTLLEIIDNVAFSQLIDTTLTRHKIMLPSDKFAPEDYALATRLTRESLINLAYSFSAQMVTGQNELFASSIFHFMSIIDVPRLRFYDPSALSISYGSTFSIIISELLVLSKIKVACIFVKTRLFANLSVALLSPPVIVVTSLKPNQLAFTNVSVNFLHSREFQQLPEQYSNSLYFEQQQTLKTRCYENLLTETIFSCANGFNMPILCNGSDAVITSFCAFAYEIVKCGVFVANGSTLSASYLYNDCNVTTWSTEQSSCICNGRLLPARLSTEFSSFDVVSFTELKFLPIQPIFKAILFPKPTVGSTPKIILVMGSIVFVTVICLVLTSGFDFASMMKKKKITISPAEKLLQMTRMVAENSLKSRSVGFWESFSRWNVYFSAFNLNFNRNNRTLSYSRVSLAFSILNISFSVITLLYRIMLGSTINCDSVELREEQACISTSDGFSNGGQACHWDSSILSCLPAGLVQPLSPGTILNVAILTAAIMTFLSTILRYLLSVSMASSISKVLPGSNEDHDEFTKEQELVSVMSLMRDCRNSLSGDERILFDNYWGVLDDDPDFLSDPMRLTLLFESKIIKPETVSERVVLNILTAQEKTLREIKLIKTVYYKPLATGFRLLYLLQKDMLSKFASSILSTYDKRLSAYNGREYMLPYSVKWFCVMILVLVNVASLAYLLWMSSHASDSLQLSCFQSFAAFIVLDAVFVESATIYVFHNLFTRIISSELMITKNKIIELISSVLQNEHHVSQKDKLSSPSDSRSTRSILDVSRIFNVSSRVARFVGGFEADVVLSYKKSLRELVIDNECPHLSLQSSLIYHLSKLSVPFQDIIVKSFLVIILGGTAVLLFTLRSVVNGWLSVSLALIVLILYAYAICSPPKLNFCKRNTVSPEEPSHTKEEDLLPGVHFTASIFRSQYYVEVPNTFLLRSEYHAVSSAEELVTGVEVFENDLNEFIENPNIEFDFAGISRDEIEIALGSFPNSPRTDDNSVRNHHLGRSDTSLERLESSNVSEFSADHHDFYDDGVDGNKSEFYEYNDYFRDRQHLSNSVDEDILNQYQQTMAVVGRDSVGTHQSLRLVTDIDDDHYTDSVNYAPYVEYENGTSYIDIQSSPDESPRHFENSTGDFGEVDI